MPTKAYPSHLSRQTLTPAAAAAVAHAYTTASEAEDSEEEGKSRYQFPSSQLGSVGQILEVGQLPSDSGRPVNEQEQYKVHFRVYACMIYDINTHIFSLFVCDMFKMYHAAAPYKFDPLVLDFSYSVSKYLACRLGADILGPAFTEKLMKQFKAIIEDTVNLVLYYYGGFTPQDLSRVSFQSLGYDFLYDCATQKVVLLEVNLNPGQGVMKRSVMCGQGMCETDYNALKTYWCSVFKTNYMNDLLNITLDRCLGIPKKPDNVWAKVRDFASPFPPGKPGKDPFAQWASLITPSPFRNFKTPGAAKRRGGTKEASPSKDKDGPSKDKRNATTANVRDRKAPTTSPKKRAL